MSLIASVLMLNRKDVQALSIDKKFDAYALHKVVYSLFEDVRSPAEKLASTPSGFLYADHGGDYKSRKILLLSNRKPMPQVFGAYGQIQSKLVPESFLQFDAYRFKVIVNPTRRESVSRKLLPIKTREAITEWFVERAEQSWGFKVMPLQIQVDSNNVLQFKDKVQRNITLAQAQIQGVLQVANRTQFIQSFSQGIGRGRAFGCGLLQITPISEGLFD
ncbi:type I-E CRISPR-associated protein Cas6/Cse3/CasE [Orrella sp. 11846]|uniref:type I-E CRISPR-associated protein Cas6/Cse3/CasE n=1 Tax=Orrella sp. 11846 TaxID=3409913 RepID=UPI003B58D911